MQAKDLAKVRRLLLGITELEAAALALLDNLEQIRRELRATIEDNV